MKNLGKWQEIKLISQFLALKNMARFIIFIIALLCQGEEVPDGIFETVHFHE